MANRVVLLQDGKYVTAEGSANGQVLTWSEDTNTASFQAGGGGGSGTVTSVGLTGGTSGIVIGGTASPITTSGTFSLDAPLRFAFDTTAPIAPTSPGQISWNATEGSLNTLMAGGNVDAIVGQQLYQRAVNADTVTLTKGMVVYVFGSSGTRASVKRATADADLSSATILGVVAESIAQNAEGFIITNGLLKDLTVLPSTTFADGDVVYLSPTTAGGLTPTKPTAPDHLVMVGYCVKASNGAAGVLLVHPQNGYELGELHDVYINSPTSGQILIYDATAGQTRWENASLTAGTGVTVTPGAGSLSIAIGQAVGTSDSPTFVQVTTTERVVTDALRARTTAGSSFSLLKIDPVSGDTNVIVQPTSATTPVAAYFAGGSLSGTSPGTAAAGYFTGGGGGSGTGNGGDAYLRGGSVSGSGLTGRVYVGDSTSRSVDIGATGITTTINGTLSLVNALAISSGGTNNVSLSVAQGTVYYGDGTKLVGLAPGTSGQFLQTQGAGANPQWASAGSATTPYDVLGRFAGNPATNAVLYSSPVPRSVTVSTTTGNHYFYASALPSAGTSVITVYKTLASNGTKSALFTATWTAGQAAASNGLYQAVIGTVSNNTLVAGDVLSVEMGTTNTSFVNPQFAVSATA